MSADVASPDRTLVILPTYNEAENVVALSAEVLDQAPLLPQIPIPFEL